MSTLPFGAGARWVLPSPAPITDVVEAVADLGLAGVLTPSVFDLTDTLDTRLLAELADAAKSRGVRLAAGVPYLHPFRLDQDKHLMQAGDGDPVAGVRRALEAVQPLGGRDVPFVLGYVEDRFSTVVPWEDQLRLSTQLLGKLAPVLRDLGLRLCIKTHEEITTFEIVRMIEAVGDDVLSVGFDPVNVYLRMEDPLLALDRVAPYVGHVYVDDATFVSTGKSLARRLCPLGNGLLDWSAILARLADSAPELWIDLHKGQYGINPYDSAWTTAHPDLGLYEYGRVVDAAATAARSFTAAEAESLTAAQTDVHSRFLPAVRTMSGYSLTWR
ncbi:sugar phosphate isomerase/epimerase family protein [Kribbella sp. GL6]|uniref:sugar phosphate isomerase/epimerase family protein n=1 Tax=Kribbella sp. GL6 TaxID=3419765 RepID=UPI003CFC8A0F